MSRATKRRSVDDLLAEARTNLARVSAPQAAAAAAAGRAILVDIRGDHQRGRDG